MSFLFRRGSGNRRRKKRARGERTAPEQQEKSQQRKREPRTSQPLNRSIINSIGSFVAAFRFLSIIPISGSFGTSEEELTRSVPFFPLVGLFFGCIALPLAWGLSMIFPPGVVAVLTVFLLLAFSGGLHLDGLADTADGFFSARPRERMLEIMRDSVTGAMGVIALILLLSLKITCLAALVAMGNKLFPAVLLMPIAGRIAILLLMALLPYARPEGGLGSLFKDSFASNQARLRALAVVLVFAGVSWAAAGAQGILVVCAVLLMTAVFALFCRQKIGGVTGDTLGAVCELAEATVALVFVLKLGGGI